MPPKLTHEEWVAACNKKHKNKYSYPEKYKNCRSLIQIMCPIHGSFKQKAKYHKDGCGCPKCGRESSIAVRMRTKESFIEESKVIHGDKYNYDNIKYINTKTHVDIFCIYCQEYFKQQPAQHIFGMGCFKCAIRLKRATNDEFIKKCEARHGKDLFDYSKVKYINQFTKITIICLKCSNEFIQTANNHTRGHGCTRCRESHGEQYCRRVLKELNIDYIPQYRIEGLGRHSFDFYFENKGRKYLLEYDGEQHFKENQFFKRTLEEEHQNDINKTYNGINSGYSVIRIDYKVKFEEIENIITFCFSQKEKIIMYLSNYEMYDWLLSGYPK